MQRTQQNNVENSKQQASVQPDSPNPFSLARSKVANLFQSSPLENQSEATEVPSPSEPSPQAQDLYSCFADRVDPSFYTLLSMPYY